MELTISGLCLLLCLGDIVLVMSATTPVPANVTVVPTNVPPPCPHDFIGHSTSCYHAARIIATWPEALGRIMMNVEEEEEIKDLVSSVPLESVMDAQIIFAHPEAFFDTAEGSDLLDSERGEKFRKSFRKMKDLPAFFPGIPRVALSATITIDTEKELLSSLGFLKPTIMKESPDRPNIILSKMTRQSSVDVFESYESIYKPLLNELKQEELNFPVTLLYMPLQYIGDASAYAGYIFKNPQLEQALYGVLCSGQDQTVKAHIVSELNKLKPNVRLVMCTSVVGMGFNSPSVSRVIHSKPPKNLQDYVQEIGRAGRQGQQAEAVLYYSPRDISANVKDIRKDIIGYCNEQNCLREYMLEQFGCTKLEELSGHLCCQFCREKCSCVECEMLRIEL